MNREELLKLHEEMCNRARALMVKKNHDYSGRKGDDPFANFRRCEAMGICSPLQGAMVRVTDKLSRLATFAESGILQVADETAEDTCDDLVNYAVLMRGMIIEMKQKPQPEPRGPAEVHQASGVCPRCKSNDWFQPKNTVKYSLRACTCGYMEKVLF